MERAGGHYELVADGFARTLAGVGEDQWTSPTPCTDWTVTDLVRHVVDTHGRIVAMLGDAAPSGVPVTFDEDPRGAFRSVSGQLLAALDDPVTAGTMVTTRGGEQNFGQLVGGLLTIDTLCHTWDLARATGQDETLHEPAVAQAHETLRGVDEAIRVPGGFAAALEAPADASDQVRFLRFTGRDV